MAKSTSSSERRILVDKYLPTELSCWPNSSALLEESKRPSFRSKDGHVRIYPPAGMREKEIEEIERETANRCVDILVEKGIFICSAVY